MIKKTAVLCLLLVYLGTTVGFAMSLHFCGTKISNVQINHATAKPCCSKEIGTKADKCCKDKEIKVKVSDQQQHIQIAKIPAISNLQLFIVPASHLDIAIGWSTSISLLSYRGPPLNSNIPLTIQNCIFRI